MDRLTSLKVFVAAVEGGSLAEAARRLGLSRVMAGRYLADLEDRLGVRLLNRTTRRLAPTEAGDRLLAGARGALEAIDQAERDAVELHTTARGTIRISAPVIFGSRHLARLLAEFQAAHPLVRLDIEFADRFVDLVEEGFDLAIRIGRLADTPNLVARKLAPARILLVASPSYVAQYGEPADIDALSAHRLLAYIYAADGARSLTFATEGGERRVTFEQDAARANSGEALRIFALQGLGIAVLPTFGVDQDLRDGTLVPILPQTPPVQLGVHAVSPAGRHRAPKVRTLIAFLAERLGPSPSWDRGLEKLTATLDASTSRAAPTRRP
ncbi:MAG: LysR family transcriptional regulator [Rhodospirillales bacterium]|nr:LysR family transcriptional regulator [Rhodospirillales bacterium]